MKGWCGEVHNSFVVWLGIHHLFFHAASIVFNRVPRSGLMKVSLLRHWLTHNGLSFRIHERRRDDENIDEAQRVVVKTFDP